MCHYVFICVIYYIVTVCNIQLCATPISYYCDVVEILLRCQGHYSGISVSFLKHVSAQVTMSQLHCNLNRTAM